MQAAGRWLVAVVGSVLAFGVVAVPWALLSKGDQWDVIAAVAGVVASGVLAALSWWAAQESGGSTYRVRQSARGRGNIRQTGGSQGWRRGAAGISENIRQKARSDGPGNIDQVGGSRS